MRGITYNGDAPLNVVDILLAINLILEGGAYNPQADLNKDGAVNIFDVVLIQLGHNL